MSSLSLSTKHRLLLNKLFSQNSEIISIKEASAVLNLSLTESRHLLQTFEKHQWIKRLKAGVYVRSFTETLDPSLSQENSWLVASHLYEPCYIGGWSAASHWEFTDQIFNKEWVFTTQYFRTKEITLGNNSYVLTHITKDYFFGTSVEWLNTQKVQLSDPHKTIVDFAHFIDQLGLTSLIDVLAAYMRSEHKDLAKIKEYIIISGNRSLFKRIGYLLEKSFPEEKEALEDYRQEISKGYSSLYPNIGCPRIVKRWNLRIPEEKL